MHFVIPERLKSMIEKKRLIFTITTGRSGTAYLARILSFVPNVVAYHEPFPRFNEVVRQVQQNPQIALDFWINKKLPKIAEEMQPIYIETSHLICKGFLEPLLEIGIVPDLIFLKRAHREVAESMYRLGSIPGRTELGLEWYISPDDNCVLPLKNWQNLHDYQLCYWYCLEIEKRSQIYKKMYLDMSGRFVDLCFKELFTTDGYKRLVKELGLSNPYFFNWFHYFLVRYRRINSKKDEKLSLKVPDQVDALEEELRTKIANSTNN